MRLLTVGTGFGRTWMQSAQWSENWENAGVVARTEKSRKRAGKDFSIDEKFQYKDLETALRECKDVDAVAITTPNVLHYDMAKMVLDSDLHLIVEKPITETWDQAVDLVRRLDAHPGKKSCVGQTLRGEVMIRLMDHFIADGLIGNVDQLSLKSHWWWVDNPKKEKNWRWRIPNMMLDDVGIHQIDEIRMLLQNRKCKDLVARTCTPNSYPLENVRATASGIWTMEDDVHVDYFSTMGAKGKQVGWFGEIYVFGEKGCMYRDSQGQPYVYLDGKKEKMGLDDEYGDDIDDILPLVEYERIPYVLEDFYHAIKEDRPPVTDLHDNINSHAILLGMKKSDAERRVVNVASEYPLP